MAASPLVRDDSVFGDPYFVYSNSDRAEVRDASGRVERRFKGETAWSDAIRWAEDENLAARRA